MKPENHNKSGRKQRILLLVKITVTIACLWYVFTRLDIKSITTALQKADWWWLAVGLLVYSSSKLLASRRLNIYFRNIGLSIPEWQNVKLYWLGLFYNLFLPGAISGDAYKVFLVSKRFGIAYKKTTAAVLLDRVSGLISLVFLIAGLSFVALDEQWVTFSLVMISAASLPILYLFVERFFPEFLPGFRATLILGALVQAALLLTVYCILLALGIRDNCHTYAFIFLIAAAASVLPVSVGGGLGVREFVIIESARLTGLGWQGQQYAFLLSMVFYCISVICSAGGMAYVFKDPLSGKKSPPRE